jgi:hypothetical protein
VPAGVAAAALYSKPGRMLWTGSERDSSASSSNLERAKEFYIETTGLEVSDEQVGHHAKFEVVPALFASNGRGLSRIPRKIRRFSSLRCLI